MSRKPYPSYPLGALLLSAACLASLALTLEHLGAAKLFGCGLESGCARALKSPFAFDWAENVGGHIFAKVQMSGPGAQFRLLDFDSVGSMSISNAPDLDRSSYAIRTQDGLLAAVMANDFGGEFLGRVGVAGQGGMLLVTFPAVYGPTLGFTPSGSVAASVEHPSGAFFFVWPVTDPPHLLWPQPLPGFVLPSN